jgi:anaerobic magnesium-protoporphyrin IX monomethyl ester cyclase
MVKPVVDILRKYGFWIHGFFVSGIPGETDYHRDETTNFIKDVGLDWSGFSLAIPSRGSELYRICVDSGYIKKDLAIDELDPNKYIINTPEYSPEHVIKKTYLMNLDVNFVNNYRMKHGDYEIAAKAFREVLKITPDHAFAHYYLAKALERTAHDSTEINVEMEHFRTIIAGNEEWKGYARFFNIV